MAQNFGFEPFEAQLPSLRSGHRSSPKVIPRMKSDISHFSCGKSLLAPRSKSPRNSPFGRLLADFCKIGFANFAKSGLHPDLTLSSRGARLGSRFTQPLRIGETPRDIDLRSKVLEIRLRRILGDFVFDSPSARSNAPRLPSSARVTTNLARAAR